MFEQAETTSRADQIMERLKSTRHAMLTAGVAATTVHLSLPREQRPVQPVEQSAQFRSAQIDYAMARAEAAHFFDK